MQRFIRLKSHQDLLNSLSDAIALVQYVSTERGVWRNVGKRKKKNTHSLFFVFLIIQDLKIRL